MPPGSRDGFAFTATEGGPLLAHLLRPPFPLAVAAARLREQLRFHGLRHRCAALLTANGGHMEELKDHLGHSPIRVTSDRYGHLFPRTRQELADGLDATSKL